MADILTEWDISSACLQSGGSTALALAKALRLPKSDAVIAAHKAEVSAAAEEPAPKATTARAPAKKTTARASAKKTPAQGEEG